MELAPAQLLGADDLADRRLHERWATEEDRALTSHDDGLVAHRGHVGAARRARPHHGGDLRDTGRRQTRLVEEDPAEVVAIRKHLVLLRQECAARIDEVDAGQSVLEGDLLRPKVLLHGHRVVGAALDGGVVADHHHVASVDQPDARDDPRAGRVATVEALGGERRQFDEGTALVEEPADAVPGEQLAAGDVTLARSVRATDRGGCDPRAQGASPGPPEHPGSARTRRRARWLGGALI